MTQEQLEKKKLKAEYKQSQSERKLSFEQLKKERTESQKSVIRILTGLVDNENLLPDDYPVNMNYLYVVEQGANDFKVIVSPITGDIKRLKVATKAIDIYSCNLVKRNIFWSVYLRLYGKSDGTIVIQYCKFPSVPAALWQRI